VTDQPTASADGTLAADWATIWQSEWAAIAMDREVQETWRRMTASWAVQADADRQSPPADAAARSARPVPPPRAPAADDAPDARDVAIASLLDRVAELERLVGKPAADPA